MADVISERLSQYFDNLLGEAANETKSGKTRRKAKNITENGLQVTDSSSKKKKEKEKSELESTVENGDVNGCNNDSEMEETTHKKKKKKKKQKPDIEDMEENEDLNIDSDMEENIKKTKKKRKKHKPELEMKEENEDVSVDSDREENTKKKKKNEQKLELETKEENEDITPDVNDSDTEKTTNKNKKKKKKKTKDETELENKDVTIDRKNSDTEQSTNKKKKKKSKDEVKPEESKASHREKRETDDGFKIVSSIPEDDSDVSDAFESCSEVETEQEEPTPTPGKKIPPRETPKETEDGFKIVTAIPEDDSDVSDAFDECYDDFGDEETASSKPKKTEDGFKIVRDVPPDDSDVSDAFDEYEDDGEGEDTPGNMSSSRHHRNIKKPILQIMNDFGIDRKALTARKENSQTQSVKLTKKQKKLKNTQVNKVTQAGAKKRKPMDVQIVDYTHRKVRKKEEKTNQEEEGLEPASVESKAETLDEKQLKRVRYDVFRLGMSGFHKEKREDTRVELAIKLGAKPPRNKSVNYKTLQVMKKDEKKKEAEEREMKLKLGLKVPKPFKKKENPVVKASSSQVGRYKHGVQVLTKRDVFKIKKS